MNDRGYSEIQLNELRNRDIGDLLNIYQELLEERDRRSDNISTVIENKSSQEEIDLSKDSLQDIYDKIEQIGQIIAEKEEIVEDKNEVSVTDDKTLETKNIDNRKEIVDFLRGHLGNNIDNIIALIESDLGDLSLRTLDELNIALNNLINISERFETYFSQAALTGLNPRPSKEAFDFIDRLRDLIYEKITLVGNAIDKLNGKHIEDQNSNVLGIEDHNPNILGIEDHNPNILGIEDHNPNILGIEDHSHGKNVVPSSTKGKYRDVYDIGDGMSEIRWAPGYTQEQIDDAIQNDIYEPAGEEYEQWLKNVVPLGGGSGIVYKVVPTSELYDQEDRKDDPILDDPNGKQNPIGVTPDPNGKQNPIGVTGPSGVTPDPNGKQNSIGVTGPSGVTPDPNGKQNPTGVTGPSGVTPDPNGKQNPTGVTGPSGVTPDPNGKQNPTGVTGPSGVTPDPNRKQNPTGVTGPGSVNPNPPSVQPQQQKDSRKNKIKKAAWFAAGAALGFGLSFAVQPGTLGLVVSAGRLVHALGKKGLQIYTDEHKNDKDNFIVKKVDDFNKFKENTKEKLKNNHPKIYSGLSKVNNFLKKPETQLFINGVAVGYTVGKLAQLAGLGKSKPTINNDQPEITQDTQPTIQETAPVENQPVTTPQQPAPTQPTVPTQPATPLVEPISADVPELDFNNLDLSSLDQGYVYSGSDNAVNLITNAGKNVSFDKINVVDGQTWVHFLQPDGKGYAWFPAEDVAKALNISDVSELIGEVTDLGGRSL